MATLDHHALANYRAVSGSYFVALSIPVTRGRGLSERDRQEAPRVVMINDAMAREFFPRENPIGRRIQLGALPESSLPFMEIVGVVANVRMLDAVIAASVSQPRFRTLLLGLFAAIALTLAAIGVYGLLAHLVAQRASEFGVRLALGASAGNVMALVLRQGLTLALAGVGIGLVASIAAVRALRTVLF